MKSQLAQQQAENSALLAGKAAVEATLDKRTAQRGREASAAADASEEMKAQFKGSGVGGLGKQQCELSTACQRTLEKYQSEAPENWTRGRRR